MWITDLSIAINELFEVYGLNCCVERIAHNVITMTNGDKWGVNSDGHISRLVIGRN